MPRRGRKPEKAKNFKGSMLRLFKELKPFKTLIILGLTMSILGSILSILAPNKLSDLVDEISKGLVINTENLENIATNVQTSLSEEEMKQIFEKLIQVDLSDEKIKQVMQTTSAEEQQQFQSFLTNQKDPKEMLNNLPTLPIAVLKIILPASPYEETVISTEDKLAFLKIATSPDPSKEIGGLPNAIANVIFKEIKIDDNRISALDQKEFLEVMATLDNKDQAALYAKIDEMPVSIKKAVEPKFAEEIIKKIVIFLIALYICSAIFTYIESISMTIVSNRFAQNLRSRISKKINKLPLKYFDQNSTGDILSRVTNDVDTISQSMNQSISSLVSAITLFLGTIFMMFITNFIMAFTAIISCLVGFGFMTVILSKSQKYFNQRQKYLGELNGHIEQIYSGLNVVKVYNGKKQANEQFDILNDKVYDANRKSQFLSGLMMPIMNFIGNFGYVAVCIVGAVLTMKGNITFGVIVAFMTYVRLFTSPLSQIGQAMTSLQTVAAAGERVFEFLDEEEMANQQELTKYLAKDKVKGDIQFENVFFTYAGNNEPTIKNFNVSVKSGQKIAIVGPTGAGKTTMVNLLMKFYDIDKGDIKIDGVSTKELTRENLHSLFTMVLQDTWLFEGTINENIIYNRPNVSQKRVQEVCQFVGLDHFIKTLPKGYDSIITENDNISAGQRQLLTIARGMIEDAPFLILDEATSNVDTRTEELVQKAMDKLMEGRTSFIIAHRLSTIKNADLILVMKDGNIIEQGCHEDLMKQNGFYAQLYNSQFEL